MAHGHEHQGDLVALSLASPRAPTEQDEIRSRQYDKIVGLGQQILSGTHTTTRPSGPAVTRGKETPIENGTLGAARARTVGTRPNRRTDEIRPESGRPVSKSNASTGTKVDSKLLEKSEDPETLEYRVRRQRLERELRDEWEQQRRAIKISYAEPILNLPDIFDRALALAHEAAPPKAARDGLSADGRIASDSFDDDTFYSSRHDTPESRLAAQVLSAEAAQTFNVPGSDRRRPRPSNAIVVDDAPGRERDRSRSMSGSYEPPPAIPVEDYSHPAHNANLSGDAENVLSAFQNHNTSGVESLAHVSGYVQANGFQRREAQQHGQVSSYVEARPPSPLIRAHNLTPAAPQPNHVSSLAFNSRLADPQDGTATARPPMAQVAALRHNGSTATSPDSSPQSGRAFDNRKKKQKKKRKADRPVESDSLVIKPEPRSPSPMNVAALPRPKKRARHGQEPDQERSLLSSQVNRQIPSTQNYHVEDIGDPGQRVVYDGGPSHHPQATTLLARDGYERDVYEQRPDGLFVRRRISPGRSIAYHDSMAPQRPRAVSHLMANDPQTEQPRYYREAYDVAPSARPERDYLMRPPTSYSRRVIVDSNGREYLEPIQPPSVRYSVAPQQVGEPDIGYDRAPPRAVSRHPGPFAPGPPPYGRQLSQAPARRVATQPEPLPPSYREYSTRPMGPSGSTMLPPERRTVDELIGNHIARSSSVRPASDRYDIAPEYFRVSSVRPPQEPAMVEYRTSVRPEYQPDPVGGYMREYRQPSEHGYVRRELSTRPMERYYEPQPGQEVAYVERSRQAPGEVLYTDEGGREIYR